MIKKYKDHSKSIKKTNLNNEIKNKKKTKRSSQECWFGQPSMPGPYLIFFSFLRGRLFKK